MISDQRVEQCQIGTRGKEPSPGKLNLSDQVFEVDAEGKPTQVIWPQGQNG